MIRGNRCKQLQVLALAAAGAWLLVLIATALINRGACAWYGHQTERETRYAAFVGCMVRMNASWVPRHELRTTSE